MRSGKSVVSSFAARSGRCCAVSRAARADVVTDWNTITGALVANDVGNNPRLRTLAMVHVAMSDAINTVQNRYTRVVATVPLAPDASAEAVAATAARQIRRRSIRNRKRRSKKPTRPHSRRFPTARKDRRHQARHRGSPARSGPIATTAPMLPIITVRTPPPAHTAADDAVWDQYARAQPWIIKRADQFRPGPRQHCRARVGADYNEVKSLGGTNSTARTAEQTDAVKFWGNVNFEARAGRGTRSGDKKRNAACRMCHASSRCSTWVWRTHTSSTGCEVPLQLLATRHGDPQRRSGRQRCHRARCRLDLLQPEPDASRIPVAGDHQRHDRVGRCGIGVRPSRIFRLRQPTCAIRSRRGRSPACSTWPRSRRMSASGAACTHRRHPHQRGGGPEGRGLHDREHARRCADVVKPPQRGTRDFKYGAFRRRGNTGDRGFDPSVWTSVRADELAHCVT